MGTQTFVSSVCRLPLVVGAHTDLSLSSLLDRLRRETGASYPTEEEILIELQESPQLVQAWQQLSEDQRISSGWYLKRVDCHAGDEWEVGFYPTSAATVYSSALSAAAAFIARYVGAFAVRG
jgi:hypothetical protein